MREIKFRAWDGRDMEYFSDLYWFEENCVHENGDTNGAGRDVLIEQFTGLKDKNGKEIYEGDVLKYDDLVGGIVVFDDGIFTANLTYIEMEKSWMEDSEIIGNIHESPELLK